MKPRVGRGVVALTIVLTLAFLGAVRYQHAATDALTTTLMQATAAGARIDLDHLGPVPPPVDRYLRRALTDGQAPVAVARFTQAGELRTDLHSDRWYRFEASQTVSPPQRGFVWNAQVDIVPLIHIGVRDAYLAGRGSSRVTLLSAVPVGGDQDRAEMNSGALHRYLAEAVWYPTALVPGNGLRWDPIDERRATATLTDAGVTVSLEFRFNEDGDVAGIYTPARWGQFDGGYRQAPWEGHFRSFRTIRGMRVPAEGEIGWYDAGVWQRVWTGHVIDTRYEFGGS